MSWLWNGIWMKVGWFFGDCLLVIGIAVTVLVVAVVLEWISKRKRKEGKDG